MFSESTANTAITLVVLSTHVVLLVVVIDSVYYVVCSLGGVYCFGCVRGQRSGVYCWSLNASRPKALSRKRCSSMRWAFLLPVAGAAAGPLPAYLRHKSSKVSTHPEPPHGHPVVTELLTRRAWPSQSWF